MWRADHVSLKSPVAVKLIDPAIARNPEARGRFMREAQAAAALRSPYVVQVFDHGVDGEIPYIAMELLEGESLAQRLSRAGRLSPIETLRVMSQVARALQKAHDAGVVHRDLKPDNVFLARDDGEEVTKLLDFGIAKVTAGSGAADPGANTRTGALLGTPYYMSPEQTEGTKAVDHRADLWALAVIGFECITGRRPFSGDALGDLVLQICVRPIPVPSKVATVPAGFDAWFAKGASRDASGRFSSAKQMVEALAEALGIAVAESQRQVVVRADASEDHATLKTLPHDASAAPSGSVLASTPAEASASTFTDATADVPAKTRRRSVPVPALVGGLVLVVAGVVLVGSRMFDPPVPASEARPAEPTAIATPTRTAAALAPAEPAESAAPAAVVASSDAGVAKLRVADRVVKANPGALPSASVPFNPLKLRK